MTLSIIPIQGSEKILSSFESSGDSISDWQIVDDGVMGGLSKGKFDISGKQTLKFSGNLSLKNNGGFSSIRSKRTTMDLSEFKGIKMRVKGDGEHTNLEWRVILVTAAWQFLFNTNLKLPKRGGPKFLFHSTN